MLFEVVSVRYIRGKYPDMPARTAAAEAYEALFAEQVAESVVALVVAIQFVQVAIREPPRLYRFSAGPV